MLNVFKSEWKVSSYSGPAVWNSLPLYFIKAAATNTSKPTSKTCFISKNLVSLCLLDLLCVCVHYVHACMCDDCVWCVCVCMMTMWMCMCDDCVWCVCVCMMTMWMCMCDDCVWCVCVCMMTVCGCACVMTVCGVCVYAWWLYVDVHVWWLCANGRWGGGWRYVNNICLFIVVLVEIM